MLSFFDYIADSFGVLLSFLGQMIKTMLLGIQILPTALSMPIGLMGYVPSILGVSIMLVVSIGVLRFLLLK